MAFGKHIRPEKRSMSLPIIISIVVGSLLATLWMFGAPTVSEQKPTTSKSTVQQFKDETSTVKNNIADDVSGSPVDRVPEVKKPSRVEESNEEIESDEGEANNKVRSSEVVNEEAVEEAVKESIEEAKVNDLIEDVENSKDVEETKVTEESISAAEDGLKNESDLPETLPNTDQAELTVENKETIGSLASQASESNDERNQNKMNEAEATEDTTESANSDIELQNKSLAESVGEIDLYSWKLCETSAAADYIPCLDNAEAIKHLKSTKHYEHRERHCPSKDDLRLCLVPMPKGYRKPAPWPGSRDKVWFNNVPHLGLISYKADQKWVQKTGDVLVFPGGGTQFKKGALHYINYVEKTLPAVAWGKRTRVVLDVGCGVASFGGYLFDKDVLTMSFAPKDEHEAQVQLALERGIPAISAVMGTQRTPFPSNVYDVVHCARCRVPWHLEGARLLVELNRVLRPGGYFIWSATPVYQREPEDIKIWNETTAWAAAMCWKRVARTKDPVTGIGAAIFQKPVDNKCYDRRKKNVPPLCPENDKADAAWYVPLGECIHRIPVEAKAEWPEEWPARLTSTPTWLEHVPIGLHGKPGPQDFLSDTEHWKRVVQKSYERGIGIDWSGVRNVMDMKAGYGGFAAALAALPVWVMNVVPVNEPDTLPVIFDRGLFGIYHDWCESFSTYPRSYDLVHADHLFVKLKERCNVTYVLLEMDRILRAEGWVVFRENGKVMKELEPIVRSLHWEIRLSYTQDEEQLLAAQKKMWRPDDTL